MPMVTIAMPSVERDTIVAGPFRVGYFIGTLITFLIVAFIIFLIVKVTKGWGIE